MGHRKRRTVQNIRLHLERWWGRIRGKQRQDSIHAFQVGIRRKCTVWEEEGLRCLGYMWWGLRQVDRILKETM